MTEDLRQMVLLCAAVIFLGAMFWHAWRRR